MHLPCRCRWTVLAAVTTLACAGPSASGPPDGPGALELEVSNTVVGVPRDSTPHRIVVTTVDRGDLPLLTVPYSGGTVLVSDLPAGRHMVRLESTAVTCWAIAGTTRSVVVEGGSTARTGFSVACFGPPVLTYDRVAPNFYDYPERFVLEPGGVFRLQFLIASGALLDFRGSYTRESTELRLDFDADREWTAVVLAPDQCLTIDFNVIMELSDFEDGTYCQPR